MIYPPTQKHLPFAPLALTPAAAFPPVADGRVDARRLHETLEIGTRFDQWFKARVLEYDFAEGVDYTISEVSVKIHHNPQGGRPRTDYSLSLDMAKELAMVERTPRGRQVRQYFIEVERRSREQPAAAALAAGTVAKIQQINSGLIEIAAEHAARLGVLEASLQTGAEWRTVAEWCAEHGYQPTPAQMRTIGRICQGESQRQGRAIGHAMGRRSGRGGCSLIRSYHPQVIAAAVDRLTR